MRRPKPGQVYIWSGQNRYLILDVRYIRRWAYWDLFGLETYKFYYNHETEWPLDEDELVNVTFDDAADEEHVLFARVTLLGKTNNAV